MKVLYFDCAMGAAGDMLTAALLELLPDRDGFLPRLNALGLPGVVFRAEPAVKCGITGTKMRVLVHGEEEHVHEHSHSGEAHHPSAAPTSSPEGKGSAHAHPHHHSHTGLQGIEHLVREHLTLPEPVREDVLAVYRLLAEAESRVHGVPMEEIHFHEVGTMDALADVAAVCLLMRELAPDRVLASPVHVGCGQVRCAHGLLPVPAPATALLLRDVPIYGGTIQGELCTPTGAALLKYYVNEFGPMPPLRPRAVGYGMGTKDLPAANCVRALLGEAEDATGWCSVPTAQNGDDGGRSMRAPTAEDQDLVLELRCNLDDMTAEAVGFAMERLLAGGALDVWTQPIGMKKSRPGILLCVLCKPKDREMMQTLLFRHTTTLGVRCCGMERSVLDRRIGTLDTAYGPVRVKSAAGFGTAREKYEFEDLARIARERELSIEEVRRALEEAR